MSSVLVFAEQRDGKIKKVAGECLAEGRRIARGTGGAVTAIVVGDQVGEAAKALARFGPDRILAVSDPRLALYAPIAYTRALATACSKEAASIVLFPASAMGRDLAPRLAVRLDAGLASDCTRVWVEGGVVKTVRPVFSGRALATAVFRSGKPAVLTLRPNVFPATEDAGSAEITPLQVSFEESDLAARTIEVKLPQTVELDVAEADIVVAGGRAMNGPENFSHIRALAEALGGAVGASRAAVDAGWIDHRYQVGQTGKVVAPKLYVACGISGAIQHLAGMSTSKVIVAINKDGDAPIFKIADYGVVGDLYKVIPALVEEVKKLKAS